MKQDLIEKLVRTKQTMLKTDPSCGVDLCHITAVQEAIDALNDVKKLLDFIKSKYPDDFKEDGRGFICPYHIALNKYFESWGAA